MAHTKKEGMTRGHAFLFEKAGQSGYLQPGRSGLLSGGAFAPYKCFAAGKTLAQGRLRRPEHCNPEGVSRPLSSDDKKDAPKKRSDTTICKAHSLSTGSHL